MFRANECQEIYAVNLEFLIVCSSSTASSSPQLNQSNKWRVVKEQSDRNCSRSGIQLLLRRTI